MCVIFFAKFVKSWCYLASCFQCESIMFDFLTVSITACFLWSCPSLALLDILFLLFKTQPVSWPCLSLALDAPILPHLTASCFQPAVYLHLCTSSQPASVPVLPWHHSGGVEKVNNVLWSKTRKRFIYVRKNLNSELNRNQRGCQMRRNPSFSSLVKIKLLHSVQAAGKKIRQFE